MTRINHQTKYLVKRKNKDIDRGQSFTTDFEHVFTR